METKHTLPGLPEFNYQPFTREDLVRNMLERKEKGLCPVQDLKFYEPWDMVEYGTEEYDTAPKASRELRLDRRERLRRLNKKR
jgi:hypothetical protein